jgi:hypothetical protein
MRTGHGYGMDAAVVGDAFEEAGRLTFKYRYWCTDLYIIHPKRWRGDTYALRDSGSHPKH